MATEGLRVTSTTWTRDSHSLFDYESASTKVEVHDVVGAMTCVRTRGSDAVSMVPSSHTMYGESREMEQLCSFSSHAGCTVVEAAKGSRAKRPWLVVRDLPPAQRALSVGDVIKLGRFEFKVRKLALSAEDGAPDFSAHGLGTAAPYVRRDEAPSKVCRICLMEGEDDDDADPLIAPCNCKGSVEHVHVGCLSYWLRSKYGVATGNGNSFKYMPPRCELCQTCFPAQVGDVGNRRPLLELPNTEPPFIVLESHQSRSSSQTPTHVVSLSQGKALVIGRGHNCDVRIDDVSLSRTHARIFFNEGAFVVEDEKSKFGTLLAMRHKQRLVPGSKLALQSGRTVVSISVPESA